MKIEKSLAGCRNKYITLSGDNFEADFMFSPRDWATPYVSFHLNQFGEGGSVIFTLLCFSFMLSIYTKKRDQQ